MKQFTRLTLLTNTGPFCLAPFWSCMRQREQDCLFVVARDMPEIERVTQPQTCQVGGDAHEVGHLVIETDSQLGAECL